MSTWKFAFEIIWPLGHINYIKFEDSIDGGDQCNSLSLSSLLPFLLLFFRFLFLLRNYRSQRYSKSNALFNSLSPSEKNPWKFTKNVHGNSPNQHPTNVHENSTKRMNSGRCTKCPREFIYSDCKNSSFMFTICLPANIFVEV